MAKITTIKQKRAVHSLLVDKGGTIASAMRQAGYSENTLHTPQKLTESEGFQREAQPYLNRLKAIQSKILKAIESKNLSKERFTALSDSLAKTTHDIELLSGNSTESQSIVIEISETVAKKNSGQ